MVEILFEGQQTDERILYVIKPPVLVKYLAIARIVGLGLIFYLILIFIGGYIDTIAGLLNVLGFILGLAIVGFGIWWNNSVYHKSKTFITDRRILRVEVVSPFFTAKRALFWNEAMKAKGYAPNLIYRFLKIGNVQVEPHMSDHENVKVTDVYLFEDVANYIDKILFTFKNQPTEIVNLKPFIPKSKGQRN